MKKTTKGLRIRAVTKAITNKTPADFIFMIGIDRSYNERLRDPPTEWSGQFEALDAEAPHSPLQAALA
jgi:hypothetical protein